MTPLLLHIGFLKLSSRQFILCNHAFDVLVLVLVAQPSSLDMLLSRPPQRVHPGGWQGEERNTGTVCNEWEQGPSDFVQHWGDDQDICFVRETVDVECSGTVRVFEMHLGSRQVSMLTSPGFGSRCRCTSTSTVRSISPNPMRSLFPFSTFVFTHRPK